MAFTGRNWDLYKKVEGLLEHRHHAWDSARWSANSDESKVSFTADPDGFFVGTVSIFVTGNCGYRIEFFFGKTHNGKVSRWSHRGPANHIIYNVDGEWLADKIERYFDSFKAAA